MDLLEVMPLTARTGLLSSLPGPITANTSPFSYASLPSASSSSGPRTWVMFMEQNLGPHMEQK